MARCKSKYDGPSTGAGRVCTNCYQLLIKGLRIPIQDHRRYFLLSICTNIRALSTSTKHKCFSCTWNLLNEQLSTGIEGIGR